MLLWFPSHKKKDTVLKLIQTLDRSTFPQRVQDLIHARDSRRLITTKYT